VPVREVRAVSLAAPLRESLDRGILSAGTITHQALLSRIADNADDKNVAGLMLNLGDMGGAWARVADLRDALADFRKTKKPVHCHVEGTDNSGFALLARSCDRISMTPGGELNLVGVSIETMYAREFLQTFGLSADIMQAGRFKGAADMLTRDDMPVEVRETMNALLDDLQHELVSAISVGRSLSPESVQALIDNGPYSADEAKRAGLIDDVCFDDEARTHVLASAQASRVVEEQLEPPREPMGVADLVRALLGDGKDQQRASGNRIVLAYLDGTIMRGSQGSYQSAHAESFVRAMRKFADDKDVRALVLRIDSPGGSALASDLMWHAVRRVVKRKPVIVSIGDMAASGGYYVASAGTLIVAQDESLVGSIGVVGGKIVAADLANRLGVHVETLVRGRRAGWQSALHKWEADDRAAFERGLRSTYERFISRIAVGRNMKPETIAPMAEGRIMTARRAREGGLVDQIGGLQVALELAKKRGGVAAKAPLEIWPERPSMLQALFSAAGGVEARSAVLQGALTEFSHAGIVESLLAGEASTAAVLPYMLTIR
jgi:protease-4